MFRRFISIFLTLALFMGAAPLEALAGVNSDYVLQVSRMDYIAALSGMEDDASEWHAGMKITENMNANQVQTGLEELLSKQINPMLKQLEELMGYSVYSGVQSNSEFQQLLVDLMDARNKAQACRDIISYNRNYIYSQSRNLKSGANFHNEHEREVTAHAVIQRTDELTAKIKEAAENYGAWNRLADRVRSLMRDTEPETAQDGLKRHVSSLKASYALAMTRRSEEEAEKNQDNAVDIIIDVVGVDTTRIYAMTDRYGEHEAVLPGANVKYWYLDTDGSVTEPKELTTNEKGYVQFNVFSDLNADEDGVFHIGYEVSCEGYQTQYVEWTVDKGGKIFFLDLKPNSEAEDIYVAGMSLNGYDKMWNVSPMITSTGNEEKQLIQVFMRSQKGGDFSGQLAMNYTNRESGESCTVTRDFSSADPNPTFEDEWCRICAPGEYAEHAGSIAFSFTNNATNAVSNEAVNMETQEAAFNPDDYPSTSDITANMIYPGTFVQMPDIPILKNMTLSCEPDLPYIAYFGMDGTFIIGATSYDNRFWKKLTDKTTFWKKTDTKESEVAADKTAEQQAQQADEIRNGVKNDQPNRQKRSFVGQANLFIGFSVLMAGKLDAPIYVKSAGDLTLVFSLTFGAKGEWSKQFMVGPVPCVLTLGFCASWTNTLQTYTNYMVDALNPGSAFTILPGPNFHDVKFTMDFELAFYASVGPGVEFSIPIIGKVKVGFGLKAIVSLKASIPFTQPEGSSDAATLTLSAGVQIIADCWVFHLYFQLVSAVFTHEFSDPWDKWSMEITPFWNGSVSEGRTLAMPSGEEEEREEERTSYQTDIEGVVRWEYQRETKWGTNKPKYFQIGGNWKDYHFDKIYSAWINEEGTAVCYCETSSGYVSTFSMSQEAKDLLADGTWKIVDFAVGIDHQKIEVPAFNLQGDPISPYVIQVGALVILLGTDFDENGVPQDCRTETSFLKLQDNNLATLERFDEKTKESYEYFYLTENGYCGYASLFDMLPAVSPDSLYTRWVGLNNLIFMSPGYADVFTICNSQTFEPSVLDIDALPAANFSSAVVKTIPSDNLSRNFIAVLLDDGTVHLMHRDGTGFTVRQLDLPKVSDIAMTTISNSADETSSQIALFCTMEETISTYTDENEETVTDISTPVKAVILENKDRGYMEMKSVSDLDVDVHGASINAGHFWKDTYLYWFASQKKEGAASESETQTRVRAICYDVEHNLMSSPFTLCILDPKEGAEPAEAASGYTLSTDPICAQMAGINQDRSGTLYFSRMWSNPDMPEGENDTKNVFTTYSVPWYKEIAPQVIGAAGIDPAVSAGGSCVMDYTVINASNAPLVGLDVGVYQNSELLEKAHVNLLDASQSSVTLVSSRFGFGDAGAVFNGESAVRRVGGLFDEINGDSWNVTRETYNAESASLADTKTEFVQVPALMSEGIHSYRMSFAVPKDWKTQEYTITVKIDAAYTIDRFSDVFDSISGSKEGADILVLALSGDTVAKAGTLADFGMVDFNNLTEDQKITDADNIVPIRFKPDEVKLVPEIAELSMDYQLTRLGGEECVVLTLLQKGQTNNAALRGLTVNAWVDDETYPSFTYTFNTHPTDGRTAFNIAVPLKRMTGGRNAGKLRVAVSDTVEENREYTDFNNSHVFYLGSTLRFIRQPEDVTAEVGSVAVFTAEAAGGKAPVSYRWQRFENNAWVDIPGATDGMILIPSVTARMDNRLIRCVAEDANGDTAISDTAKLTVTQSGLPGTGDIPVPPDTGDATPVPMLLIMEALLLCAVIWLARRQRT